MGIIEYYHKFIDEWMQRCHEFSEKINNLLTVAPLLKITHLNKDFFVCTNAFLDNLEWMIMQ